MKRICSNGRDLAKTVNGDYFAIPPIKLRGALAGTYMHLIEGTGNVVLGPSEISLKATDVGIVGLGKNAQFIDSFVVLSSGFKMNTGAGMSASPVFPYRIHPTQTRRSRTADGNSSHAFKRGPTMGATTCIDAGTVAVAPPSASTVSS